MAITIGIDSTSSDSTSTTEGPTGQRAGTEELSVTNPGGTTADAVGASVGAATRYASNAAADRTATLPSQVSRWTWNSDYVVSFSVTPANAGTVYEVVVDTSILGELTLLDDGGVGAASASVSNVIGYLESTPTAGLGISGIATSISTTLDASDAAEKEIVGSNSINLGTFSGTQLFKLRFTFQTEAFAPQNGDEAAARFGASGTLSNAGADNYPGPGDVVDRVQANDGHFVNITANVLTVVPEPGTLLLLGSGLAGLALRRRPPAA